MGKKVRILGIAPYEAMQKTMIRAACTRDDIEVTALVGNMEDGANIVRQYENDNFDAIVSRGGTLLEIKKVTRKPVFEVPISYFDLLNVIKLVEHYVGKIAIITYPNIANSAKALCAILHYDYKIFETNSRRDAKNTVQNLKEKGYSLIIGDAVSVFYAREQGIQAILLTSGRDSINKAYNDAVRVCTYYAQLKKEHSILESHLRIRNERIIALDEAKNLVYQSNPYEKKSLITLCRNMVSSLKNEKKPVIHKKVQNCLYMITGESCLIGDSLYYLFVIEQSQLKIQFVPDLSSVEVYNRDDYLAQNAIHGNTMLFCGIGHSEFEKRCDALAKSDASLLIIAESGTGKERLAQQLYMNSGRTQCPFYVVNCSLLSQKDLDYLLYEKRSPFYAFNGTVFFKNIQNVKNSLFDKLVEGLEHVTRMRKSRLIFSYEINTTHNDVKTNMYHYEMLKEHLGCMEIRLPPLRKCLEDIPNMSILYIHQQNRASDKSIVGLEPEAIEVLQGYSWPHNIKQLERILHEAILMTDSPWISAKTIRQLLSEDKSALPMVPDGTQINIKQPLTGILYDVVLQVLAEENMNQSSTAKRLGIGRTTLWRILKRGKIIGTP